MARGRRCRRRARRTRPGPPDPRARRPARAARRQRPDREHHHPVREHDPARARGRSSRRRSVRLVERRLRSIIRWNAMAMVVRANKLSSELGGHIASFQSLATLYEVGYNHFWHAPSGRARRRPRLLPGPLLARQLRARVPRGAAHRGAARQLPPGGRRRRPVLLSAPVADARVLAVPDGVARDRRDHLDLPGAVHEVPRGARRRADRGAQGVGVPRRRRDGRARDDGRDRARRARAARQPDLGRELQPAAARRPGPRQRQDHPGARGRLPRRRLERDQGRVGIALGPAARRRTPTAAWSR